MNRRRFVILSLVLTLIPLCRPGLSQAATRARSRAETVLNDPLVRLAVGFEHTCQVKDDGTIRCWGRNTSGQLGDGTTTTIQNTPVLVIGLTSVVAVSAGNSHTCALIADGTVRCWGSNVFGALGDGTTTDRLTAVSVIGVANVVAIAAGGNHTCALLADGTARCWGFNREGQVGDGTSGVNRLTPVGVVNLTNAVAISAAGGSSCALRVGGDARCWGLNNAGQLGDGSLTDRSIPTDVPELFFAVAITVGGLHTCVVVADGSARCWGDNRSGRLGDGTQTSQRSPVPVAGLSNIVSITAGGQHTCALLANGDASCWGGNRSGQLGNGTTSSREPLIVLNLGGSAVALDTGFENTCAVLTDGSARCWGGNTLGQLGNGTTESTNQPTPVLGGGGSITVRDLAAGLAHTCAVRANGTVACWGNNTHGNLGVGDNTTRLVAVTVPGITNAVAVAAGDSHTCALLGDGSVRCWGRNFEGQLGDATQTSRSSPVRVRNLSNAIAISGGSLFTCALLANGTVSCWGSNINGQHGDGSNLSHLTPSPVPGFPNAAAVTTGQFHTCALRADGFAACWGANDFGQLSTGDTTTRFTPAFVNAFVGAVAISAGDRFTCAVLSDGTGRCWGRGDVGQRGDGTTAVSQPRADTPFGLANTIAVADGPFHACAVSAGGRAFCWGRNGSGEIGDGTTTMRVSPTAVSLRVNLLTTPLGAVTQMATGSAHTCALQASGRVLCWGANNLGQLGDGTTVPKLQPTIVPSITLNIDPSVALEDRDDETTVTILALCEEDQWLHVDALLTQGDVTGHGTAQGKCTGGLARYPVTVAVRGHDLAFLEGAAVVEANAIIRGRGGYVETQSWTRRVEILEEEIVEAP